MSVPNFKSEIEALVNKYPSEWRNAHTGNAQTEDFVRIVAWELHKLDPKVGLNGKRGNYNDISDDVINYFGEGPGHDPRTNAPITVVDFIIGAGGPNPSVGWQIIDQAGPGAWIKPDAPKGVAPEAPKPEAPVVPVPVITVNLDELTALVMKAVDAAKSSAHDAKVAAESSLRIEDQLKRGFYADLSARYIGAVKGAVKPVA